MRRLDVTGSDDQDHLAVIGAAIAQSARSMAGQLGLKGGAAIPDWFQNASPQGVSTPAEELDYLPLDGIDTTFAAPGDLDDELVSNPQRPFRGERVIMTCVHISGAGVVTDALFRLIIVPAMYVGAVQIGATQGNMPAVAFGPTSFGVRLSMPVAGQGTRIYIPVHMAGLLATERVIIAGGIFGRAVR